MALLYVLFVLLLFDFIRSVVQMIQVKRYFEAGYRGSQGIYTTGKGPRLTVALIGDSGIDGHHTNQSKYGPYGPIIDQLAKTHTVEAHVFATQGAKTRDVLSNQLPKVKRLKQVDIIFVYMGANNILRGYGVAAAIDDYDHLLAYAESKQAIVIASEIADYYMLKMFSLIHRLIIYMANKRINRLLRKSAAKRKNFILIPITGITKKYFTKVHQADGLHPNDKGLVLWGQFLLEDLRSRREMRRYF